MRRTHVIATVVLGSLALVAVAAAAADTKLSGTVGPGFTITLRDAQGEPVTRLPAGQTDITVDDRSDEHNFHLRGPGVDIATGLDEIGVRTFTVTLSDGAYTFVCDPHAADMRGSFDVGEAQSDPPPPIPTTTPRPTPSAKVGARLALTVGPGFAISLETLGGKRVTVLRPGAYTVVARDRSTRHNARLRGAGAARATGIGFVGTRTWRVVLRKGTLVIVCDPHKQSMRATVRIV